jgi:hypothetical protein
MAPLGKLAQTNPRFVTALAQAALPRAAADRALAARFNAWIAEKDFEFTEVWTDQNLAYVAPVLKLFAAGREAIDYLEIGVYEARNLAFMDWLLPDKLDVTVIDPWFDETLNPEAKYVAIEPRFKANAAKLNFRSLEVVKGFSTYELPRMLQAERGFDLIYVDGSHAAWSVYVDLCYAAAVLRTGGLMILDDYWHDTYHGGPGVKQAVDAFHSTFRKSFEVVAAYRQIILRKTSDIPR